MINNQQDTLLELAALAAKTKGVNAVYVSITEKTATISAYSKTDNYTNEDCKAAAVYLTGNEHYDKQDIEIFKKTINKWKSKKK